MIFIPIILTLAFFGLSSNYDKQHHYEIPDRTRSNSVADVEGR